jgi:hypothetical protein
MFVLIVFGIACIIFLSILVTSDNTKKALRAPFLFLVSIITTLSYGYVLPKLWAWFIIPIFHLPPLPFWYAVGIMTTICLFRPVFPANTPGMYDNEVARNKVLNTYYCMNLFYPWMALLSGWIITICIACQTS